MSQSRMIKYSFIMILIMSVIFASIPVKHSYAFTNQVIQRGATGEDVIELQARLQYIGFYHGQIDGVFGWGTYWALRNFQSEFGLPVDGLAGLKTRQKLVSVTKFDSKYVYEQLYKGKKFTYYGGTDLNKQTTPDRKQPIQNNQQAQNNRPNQTRQNAQPAPAKQPAKKPAKQQAKVSNKPTAVNVPNGYSQNDIQLMANAVHGEARGEPYIGKVAVAAVILNRVASPSFPNTISGVIFEPGAFTAVADGQIWLTPDEISKKAVIDAINGWDPTGNAIYYFNPNTATSGWIWSRPQIKRIGKHIFCK